MCVDWVEIRWNLDCAKMETASQQPQVCLDLASARLIVGDNQISLTPRLFSVLRHFAENPRRVITKQELLDNVWPHTHVTEELVKDYVRKVRRLLNDDPVRPHFIETARGMGYRLIGDIQISVQGGMSLIAAKQRSPPAIAVLPFMDRTESGDQEYFASGIAEDIMVEPARFRSMIVIARDSSFLHGSEPEEVQKLARQMDVDFIVEGSVRRAEGRLRISVQLIESEGRRCFWAENYDRQLEDVFAVQDEIARVVASHVVGHIEESSRQRALRKRPGSLAAYEYLLIGNWYLRKATGVDVAKAREMLQRVIDIEPTNARAYSEMAFSYLTEFWSDWTPAPKEAANKALAWARKATALDDLDARAHLYLATAFYYAVSNFDAANREFDRALQLNPNDYDVFCLRSWLLALSGRADECISCAEYAIRLSPLTTEDCRLAQSCASYCARRYDDALAALRSIPEPTYQVNAFLAMCHAQLGQKAEAERAVKTFLETALQEIVDQPDYYQDGWRGYWTTRYPFKQSGDLEHMLEGLSKAGMPINPRVD